MDLNGYIRVGAPLPHRTYYIHSIICSGSLGLYSFLNSYVAAAVDCVSSRLEQSYTSRAVL